MNPYRIAIISYHPMPYHAAFYRQIHKDSRVDEVIFYLDDFGVKSQMDPEFNQNIYWDNEILEGYKYHFFRNYSWNKFRPLISRINPGVIGFFIKGKFDAVLTDYATGSAWFVYIAALMTKCPIIMRTESDLDRPYMTFLTRVKRLFLSSVLSKCSAVMYSCKKNKEYFLSYGVAERKLFPLLSSVDNSYYLSKAHEKEAAKQSIRSEYEIPLGAVVVLYTGRLIERKRPIDLLRACAIASQKYKDIYLVYVGDGPERSKIENGGVVPGYNQVVITGFINQSELWKYYLMADIYVMPSEWDPTPKALNEAVINGLPCIVTDKVGQADDLIIGNGNGYVFPVGDYGSLSGYILNLANSEELRNKYSVNAISRAKEWSPDKNVDGLVAALDYIYDRKKRC